jgi:amidohydrolase
MHACGHDGHMAIGLGVATLLAARQDQLRGRVKFIFQPAEEPMGGALAMIEDGALDAPVPDVALGLHLWNGLPLGKIAVTPGPVMAGAETFAVQIDGQGGHAGMPHETRDPAVAAAHVVTALQSAVSRNLDPLDSAVLSVTGLQTGTAANAVPMSARLSGTIRTFTPATRALLLDRLETIATGVAGALGCTAHVDVAQEARPVVNDPAVAARVRQVAADLWGDSALAEGYRTTAAEDMAYFLERAPGCFVLLGAANAERGLDFPHHHPRFDFDEAALVRGAALLACAAATYLLPRRGPDPCPTVRCATCSCSTQTSPFSITARSGPARARCSIPTSAGSLPWSASRSISSPARPTGCWPRRGPRWGPTSTPTRSR